MGKIARYAITKDKADRPPSEAFEDLSRDIDIVYESELPEEESFTYDEVMKRMHSLWGDMFIGDECVETCQRELRDFAILLVRMGIDDVVHVRNM